MTPSQEFRKFLLNGTRGRERGNIPDPLKD